jgi:hypothetical protein
MSGLVRCGHRPARAQAWFNENAAEGVAFKHETSELRPAGSADQYGAPLGKTKSPSGSRRSSAVIR